MNTVNRARQLQDRTKKFAVRIVNAFARLPKDEAARVIGANFFGRELRWLRIIGPVVEHVPPPTSFRRSVW